MVRHRLSNRAGHGTDELFRNYPDVRAATVHLRNGTAVRESSNSSVTPCKPISVAQTGGTRRRNLERPAFAAPVCASKLIKHRIYGVKIDISSSNAELGKKAARRGAEILRLLAKSKDRLTLVVPTGASQLAVYDHLVRQPDIPWERIDAYHLDEYVGIAADHPGSFRRYLRERFVCNVPTLGSFEEIRGDAPDTHREVDRLNDLMSRREIDLCFAGIGENGHLAFNDPPADFNTTDPYILVTLDHACRHQQFHEGWFKRFEDVPEQAISMSVRQIMKSKYLVVSVPGKRKAKAVKASLESAVCPQIPASILQQHDCCDMFLDNESSCLLGTHIHD